MICRIVLGPVLSWVWVAVALVVTPGGPGWLCVQRILECRPCA